MEIIDTQVEEMLANGVIEPSDSPWANPIVLVKKHSDNSYRFCLDFRSLNKITKTDSYPLPRIDATLDALGSITPKYFTTLDLMSGFHQMALAPSACEKTAFATPGRNGGFYQFKKMPFGLKNSPSSFMRLMSRVLQGLTWRNCLIYLDDIIIFSSSFDQHIKDIESVFGRLRQANLRLKLSKCHFAKSSVKFLGHVVSQEGV